MAVTANSFLTDCQALSPHTCDMAKINADLYIEHRKNTGEAALYV